MPHVIVQNVLRPDFPRREPNPFRSRLPGLRAHPHEVVPRSIDEEHPLKHRRIIGRVDLPRPARTPVRFDRALAIRDPTSNDVEHRIHGPERRQIEQARSCFCTSDPSHLHVESLDYF